MSQQEILPLVVYITLTSLSTKKSPVAKRKGEKKRKKRGKKQVKQRDGPTIKGVQDTTT
jgi:hypothetical protein